MRTRRSLLGQFGSLALVGGAAWLLRDQILWRRPEPQFAAGETSSGWLPFAGPRGPVVTVDATVDGRPIRALVDSGAQYSVIDTAFAAQLGLPGAFAAPMIAYGVGGKPQLGRGVSLDVGVGGLALPGMRAAVLDLGPISGGLGLSVPLVLGQDLLNEVIADIDFPRRRVRFVQPQAFSAPDGAFAVPARRKGRALLAQVSVEGAALEPVLDTGASSALVLAHDVAEAAGLLNGRDVRPTRSLVLGGVAAGRMVTVSTLAFGGEVLRNVPVHIYQRQPMPGFPGSLLGVGALRRFRAVLDHGRGQLQLVRRSA
ncbi:retropepsin-like aspartic protease [Phenylobacterium sp.]|uniref:retropepsin-like aspartic protease n=1 Tax=Phenylobacterium sp. TaxID=1871053 RepID=UPI002E35D2CE|nr:retropepsin-like aspartic protease [Phenylobacterium sp.]HEX2561521.1 retropepsin-like aspartic protease [Phenylobacterium sp.]